MSPQGAAGAQRKKLGLALGAGGARGVAHAGVLFALADAGIAVDAIAGTSIGALVGALWATGQLEVFERGLRSLELSDLLGYVDPVWPRSGLLSGERATEYLRSLIGDWRIEDLPIPYAAVAVDLVTGEEIWIRTGRLLDAVRASISVPGIFVPRAPGRAAARRRRAAQPGAGLGAGGAGRGREGRREPARAAGPRARATRAASPGGVADRRGDRDRARALPSPPATSARAKPPARADPAGPNLIEILTASMSVLEHEIARHRLAREPVDVVLAPDVRGIRSFEFHKGPRAVAAGRTELESKLPEIRAALAKRPRLARYFSLGSSS